MEDIISDRELSCAGWVGKARNPNENNVGVWFASKNVVERYSYVVIFKKSSA